MSPCSWWLEVGFFAASKRVAREIRRPFCPRCSAAFQSCGLHWLNLFAVPELEDGGLVGFGVLCVCRACFVISQESHQHPGRADRLQCVPIGRCLKFGEFEGLEALRESSSRGAISFDSDLSTLLCSGTPTSQAVVLPEFPLSVSS